MDDQDQLANANPHWTGVSDEIYMYSLSSIHPPKLINFSCGMHAGYLEGEM